MDLRQLEYFVAVAEEANFTRAAARVHISQSGISAQLRALERDLGAELIDRSGRRATLTDAGEAALEHARRALASAEAVRRAVDDVGDLVRGRLAVGMVTGSVITPLFDALASFRTAHPGVDIALVEAGSDQLVAAVRDGSLDLALVATSAAPPEGLDALPIIVEPLVAAVAPDHPLARRARVTLAELVEHPVVCLPAGTGVRTAFDQACGAHGLSAEVVLQASAPGAVADLAVRGLGVAVLGRTMASDHVDRLRVVALADVEQRVVLALVWSAQGGPALRDLRARAERAFAPPPRAAG